MNAKLPIEDKEWKAQKGKRRNRKFEYSIIQEA